MKNSKLKKFEKKMGTLKYLITWVIIGAMIISTVAIAGFNKGSIKWEIGEVTMTADFK